MAKSEGVQLLLDAWDCAREINLELWQFAVEIGALRRAGLTNTDLRWLLTLGLSAHAEELTQPYDSRRQFSKVKSLALADNHCFVLTGVGHQFLQRTASRKRAAGRLALQSPPGPSRSTGPGRRSTAR